MDAQERMLLVGEQTLLSEERATANASRHSQQAQLLTLINEINACHGQPRWLEKGIKLLTDLHATQTRLMELDTRINEIRVLTGR